MDEKELISKVKDVVRRNLDDFQNEINWLREFCSDTETLKRMENQRAILQLEHRRREKDYLSAEQKVYKEFLSNRRRGIDKLISRIKNKDLRSPILRLKDAFDTAITTKPYSCRKILLTYWRLTDRYGNNQKLGIPVIDVIGSCDQEDELNFNEIIAAVIHENHTKVESVKKALEEYEIIMPKKTTQDATDAKERKGNVNVNIYGDAQAKNLQIANDASIHEQPIAEEKKKGSIKKLLKIIATIIAFIAALLTSLYHLGWLEPIKAFIDKILWPK